MHGGDTRDLGGDFRPSWWISTTACHQSFTQAISISISLAQRINQRKVGVFFFFFFLCGRSNHPLPSLLFMNAVNRLHLLLLMTTFFFFVTPYPKTMPFLQNSWLSSLNFSYMCFLFCFVFLGVFFHLKETLCQIPSLSVWAYEFTILSIWERKPLFPVPINTSTAICTVVCCDGDSYIIFLSWKSTFEVCLCLQYV